MNEITNRITANKVLLINWSRFQYVTFEMSGSTLITGVNGTGKSTVLDAITYLVTGNTKFNLAAKDKDRGVKAYVRGDTRSNGASRYLRSGEVISYIAMEFENPVEGKPLVVGVNIESVSEADPAVAKWFVFRDTRLSDIKFCQINEKTGGITMIPRGSLTVRGARPKASTFLNKSTGIPQVLRALGVRADVRKYQSKLTKMMAFNPENNIDRFIQESVLEDDPVTSLEEIRQYREQYAKVKEIYDDLLAGRNQLEKVEESASIYERRRDSLEIHELMLDYQNLMAVKKEQDDIVYRMRALKQRKFSLDRQTKTVERHLEAAKDRLVKAKSNALLVDVQGTLDDLNNQVRNLTRDLEDAEKRQADVLRLKKQIAETFSWDTMSVQVPSDVQFTLERLDEEDRAADEKAGAFFHYIEAARKQMDVLTSEQTHLHDHIRDEEAKREELYSEQKKLASNQIIYDRKASEAKQIIERELKKQGITTDVFLFAELVKDIKDPRWRMAIETFLGYKRFHIIVEEKYVRDVMKIIDDKNIFGAHAVMTDRLPGTLDETRKGSAAEMLVISNRAARRYANYMLNGIHLCSTIDELHDHPLGGLMQNGMLAKSYAVSKMDIKDTRICLGKDAIEIQKKEVERKITECRRNIMALQVQMEPVSSHVKSLVAMNLDTTAYDFGAAVTMTSLKKDMAAIRTNIKKISETPAFQAALQEQTDANDAYTRALAEHTRHTSAIQACVTSIAEEEKNLTTNKEKEKRQKDRYEEHRAEKMALESSMLEEYERLTRRSGTVMAIQESTVVRQRAELSNQLEPALRVEQQKYLKIVGRIDELEILVGPSQIPFYRAEFTNLRNVKIDEARQQLEAKTQQLEDAFMNDFVAELKEKMDRAHEEMEEINRELKATPFGSDTYRFEMKPRSDRSAFFNIIKRLDDYKDSPEMMMAMEQGNTQLDHDIQEFMSLILSDENEEEYIDYRSYYTYDMRIISQQGTSSIEADLSKKQGSASGGEKQTPYFIILAASLLQCYPRDTCCERLAFIDEAFSALSRERIEQMVKYLEDNHFQVIYAAPPEKIDSIGSYIDTTVSLVTKGRYTFAIEGLQNAV